MRRSLIALSGYAVITMGSSLVASSGLIRGISLPFLALFMGLFVAMALLPPVLIRKGVNLRFKDPSLTLPQLLQAILFVTVFSYFLTSEIRGVSTVLYILIFVFGTFRLKLREFLGLVALTVALYGGAMVLLAHSQPEEVSTKLEVTRWVILLLSLLWVSYMANYIANLRRRIKLMASFDPLTEVYNRREIFEILDREKSFSDRSGIPFSLCILDLDDFKEVNDTYGHQAGDRVLKAFARALKENVRTEDYVGRYGGEEFLVVFVNFDCRDNSATCVARLLNVTQRLTFPGISNDLKITTSIGVSAYRPSETIDAVVARADQALYEAKAAGKNRIVCNDPCRA
ncbi:MAG: GGDEF domain-containing protein [Thermodesulfobacteriota bacterium]